MRNGFVSFKRLAIVLMFILVFQYVIVESAHAKTIIIKIATMAPKGSPWHTILQEMGEEWKQASNGQIQLRIYPGGVAGSEMDIVRKMRIGQLHAAAVSIGGLSRIDPGVNVLGIPMAVDSWEVLDLPIDRRG